MVMGNPTILGLATGVPGWRYSQEQIYETFLEPILGTNRKARAIFKRSGIAYRHVSVPGDYYRSPRMTEERNDRYMQEALPLGAETIERVLAATGLGPRDVDDFIVVSCTGFDIPGLDLRLAGQLGMRQ